MGNLNLNPAGLAMLKMAGEGGEEANGVGTSACGSSECSSIRGVTLPNPKNNSTSFSMRSARHKTIPLNAKQQKYINQFGESFNPELYSGYVPPASSGSTSLCTPSWDVTHNTPPSWDRTRRTPSPGNSTPYSDMYTAPTSTIYDGDIYWPSTTRSGIEAGVVGATYVGGAGLPAGAPAGAPTECPATFGLGAGAANTMNQCPAAANYAPTYKGCGPCSPCAIAARNAAPNAAVGGATFVGGGAPIADDSATYVRGGVAVGGGGATVVGGGATVVGGGATFAGGCGGNCSNFTEPSFNLADNLMSSRLPSAQQFDSTIGPPLGQSTPVHVSRVERTSVTQSPCSPSSAKAASISSANPTQASLNLPSMQSFSQGPSKMPTPPILPGSFSSYQSTLTASPAPTGQSFGGSRLTVSPGQNSSSRSKDEFCSQLMELTDYYSTRESVQVEEGMRSFQRQRRQDLNATMRRTDTQQLVIPKGMLGPEEVAVIEIPKRFHKSPIVVLKRRPGELARIRASHYFVEAPYDLDPAMRNTRFMNPDVSGQTGQNITVHPQSFVQNSSGFSNISSGSNRVAHKNVTMAPPPGFVQEPSRFSNVSSASPRGSQQFMGVTVAEPTFIQPQVVYPQPMMSPQGSYNYSSSRPAPDYNISGASCMSYKSGCGGGLSGSECPGQVDLLQKEKAEKEMLTRSLDEFQTARRKFLGRAKVLTTKISKISIDSNDS